MGWNSWNKFACNVNEKLVRSAADQMVASGMKDAGYHYTLIDDCWQGERDKAGDIQADPQKFPSGIKVLADYVHTKNLLLGIYSDAGTMTCGKRSACEWGINRPWHWGAAHGANLWRATGDIADLWQCWKSAMAA